MKKTILALAAVLGLVTCGGGGKNVPNVPVDSISVGLEGFGTAQIAYVYVGETTDAKSWVGPAEATNKRVTWSSSDTNIATILDATGPQGVHMLETRCKVKGVSPGTATITGKADGGEVSASRNIEVRVHAASVSLDRTTLEVAANREVEFSATVLPENAYNKRVTWSSSNTSVAGNTPIAGRFWVGSVGTARITVTTVDGGHTAFCDVTVTPA